MFSHAGRATERGPLSVTRLRLTLTQDPYLSERARNFLTPGLNARHFVVVEQPFMPISGLRERKSHELGGGSEVEPDDRGAVVRPPAEDEDAFLVVDQDRRDVVELERRAG